MATIMRHTLLFIALALMVVSCGKSGNDNERPEGPNTLMPIRLSSVQQSFVTAGNNFAFDFIKAIDTEAAKKGDDYIVSPLSMQFLLGMILNGAKGQTASEICDVLGYGSGQTAEVNAFCKLMLGSLPAMDKKTKLSIANAIYVDEGYDLLPAYKDSVANYFDAAVANLRFADGKASADKINKWCSDHTNGMIDKILDETTEDMLAYLLDAMYFKSEWMNKFDKSATRELDFTPETGTARKLKMMCQEHSYMYGEDKMMQAVRLPYGNAAFSMTVFLPKTGFKVSDIVPFLPTAWNGLMEFNYQVDLQLPRFQTKYHILLNDILSAMGMPSAFDKLSADFSAMSPDALSLSFVQQDAAIKVDESGSEAAVVSSAGVEKVTSASPAGHVSFHADHPFLYIISENTSGVILFAGKYSGK